MSRWAALAALLVLQAAGARAQGPSGAAGQLVFLPVSGDGAGVSDGLHRLIRAELTHSAPQRLIDVPPQSLGDLQREAGCDALEAACLGRIARFLGCEVAVLLRVGSSQGGRVVATLELVSAAGEVRGHAERVAAGPRADVALTAAVPGFVDELFGRAPEAPQESPSAAASTRATGSGSSAVPPPETGPRGSRAPDEESPGVEASSSSADCLSDREPRAVGETPRASSPRIERDHARTIGDSEGGSDFPLVAGGSLLGLGMLAGIAGLVTGLVAASAEDEWLAAPRESRADIDQALDERDRAERWATTTNVLLVSAGVLAAAGVALLVVGMASEDEDEGARLSVVPVRAGAVAVLSVEGLL